MNLPPELQQFVGHQMAHGIYDTFEDLVVDALNVLREKRRAELLEEIDIGRRQIENGECTVIHNEAELDAFFDGIIHGGRAERAEPAA